MKFSRYLLHSLASDVHYRESGHKGLYNSGQIGAQTPTPILDEKEDRDSEASTWIIHPYGEMLEFSSLLLGAKLRGEGSEIGGEL